MTPAFVDYYEVIFKEHGATGADYHRGSANLGEALSVAVPAGESYDVLLLAGIKQYRTLLGSAFVNTNDANDDSVTGDAGFNANGTGFYITSGTVNVISVTLEPIAVDPVGDFVATLPGTTLSTPTINRIPGDKYDNIAKFTMPKQGGTDNDLSVDVSVNGLGPLIQAEFDGAAYALTFVSKQMTLKPYMIKHTFAPSIASTITGPNTGSNVVTDDPATFADTSTSYKTNYFFEHATLPNVEGAYGSLYFNLKYAPFGDLTAGRSWNIRNGFNFDLDKDGGSPGSAILVIIGDDPGDFVQGTYVDIDTN
jgi:hypothetical protein